MSTSIGFDIFARDHASQTFDKLGKKVDDSGSKFSKFGAFAGAALAGAGIALAGFAVGAVKKASDLNETINKSNVIFGKNADAIDTWAKGAAKSMGLSRQAALEAASGFGNMFAQLGFTSGSAADMSKKVVQLSADLGSFNNLPTAEVTDMISAAFRGEYDSLQRLIPNISAARVQTEALKETGKKNVDQLTAQEKATATLTIIQRDGSAAAGDFARTSDGLANQTKIARARFEDLQATIGTKLLPVMNTLMAKALDFADWLEKNPAAVKALAIAMGVLAVAIGVATAAWVAMNLAFVATPIGAIITGLVLLGAALVVLYTKSQTFRDIVSLAFAAVKIAALGLALQAVIAFRGLLNVWLTVVAGIVHGAALAFGWVPGLGPKLREADSKVTGFKNSVNTTLGKVQRKLEIELATAKAQLAAAALKYKLDQIKSRSIYIALNYRVTAGRIWDGSRWVNVGQFASGTPSAPRGWAWVGEKGAELVRFRGGEQVIPAGESAAIASAKSAGAMSGAIASGTTIVVNVNGPTIGTPQTIAQQVHQALLNLKQTSGVDLKLA